jgi:spermidine synthase
VKPRIIYLAIFLSGFASLGYQLCWIRKGALLIGATPQALGIVVAVFFAGLAVGAYLFGLFSKRTVNPLLWYGILECAIGLIAAATPALFGVAGDLSALAYQWADSSQTLHLLVRSSLVAALILPASVLMGGTLPLLCQFSINNRQADIRIAAGILYAVNTSGAFLGCLLCGVCFIPLLGVNASIWFNALLSFAVGVGAIRFSGAIQAPLPSEVARSVQLPERSAGVMAESKLIRFIMYVLFFLAGFTALGYEILWVRFLSLLIHNTIYTCIFSIGATLLGIAVGGLVVFLLRERPWHDALLFGAANIFIGLSVLSILFQSAASWEWIRGSQSVSMQALLSIFIILIPSIASGISFQMAYRLIAANRINSGRDFGYLTAVSTLGGITGSLLVSFHLLPAIGIYKTLIILTCISVTIGAYAIFALAERIALFRRGMIVCAAAAVWFGIVLSSDTNLPSDFLAQKPEMIEFAEGFSSFIAVVKRDGDKILEIDRMWQGQKQKGHQILAAHIPMILHQNPKRVLVIGMGTGQTASRFLMYDIERLDCVDIEKTLPGILQRHFDSAWLGDPRAHVVTDDGRSFTSYSRSAYDIVSIEVGQSFRPQAASFYTVDFYRDVKKRLTKDGLACQFVPLGFFSEEEFRSVLHSFLEVFPQSTLWLNKYAELILIGNATSQPLLNAKRLGLLRSDWKINADLDYSFDNKPWLLLNNKDVFASNFLMGPETLSKLSVNAPRYSDDRPILEYQTARNIYAPGRFHELIEKNLESPDTIFERKVPAATRANIFRIREETVHEMLTGKSVKE